MLELRFLFLVSLLTGTVPEFSALSMPSVAISALYLAFFSTALALVIFFHLIKQWGAVKASSVTFIVPIQAIFLDRIFFSSSITFWETVGIGCIFIRDAR